MSARDRGSPRHGAENPHGFKPDLTRQRPIPSCIEDQREQGPRPEAGVHEQRPVRSRGRNAP